MCEYVCLQVVCEFVCISGCVLVGVRLYTSGRSKPTGQLAFIMSLTCCHTLGSPGAKTISLQCWMNKKMVWGKKETLQL